MPSPRSEDYRNQVQTRIQDLLTGNRPRDPHLSTVSTQRLIIEGIVEEIRIYRLHKEEKAREEKDRRKREKKGMSGHGRQASRGREKRHRRHGSGERHRDERRRHRSGERDRRHASRDRSRNGSDHKRSHGRRDRAMSDLVTEGRPDPNPDLMMTGGAGPAGTLPPAPNPSSESPSRQPKPGRAGVSRSPTRRHGPDGKTPFGQLPKKAIGVGFVAHVQNTYKHIKADHEAGHRSRGVLERTVDGWRGKKPGADVPGGGGGGGEGKQREPEKLRKEGRRGRDGEGRGRTDERTLQGHDGNHHRGHDEGGSDRGRPRERDVRRNDRDDGRKDDERRDDHGSHRSDGTDARNDNASDHIEGGFGQPNSRKPSQMYDHSWAPGPNIPSRRPLPHLAAPIDTQSPYRPPSGAHPHAAYKSSYVQPSPATSVHPRAATTLDNTNLHFPPPGAPSHAAHDDLYKPPSPVPSVNVQGATPPSYHHDKTPVWVPTPDSFRTRSRTPASSRPYGSVSPERPNSSHRHSKSPSRERFESRLAAERSITPSPPYSPPSPERRRSPSRSPSPPYPDSPFDRSISPIQMPPPPGDSAIPSPPPLPPTPKATPNHAALLGQIQGNTPKLRKVRSREKRDASTPDSVGQIYQDTAHSRDVEERERSQAWSDDGFGDGEAESQRRRELKKNLGK